MNDFRERVVSNFSNLEGELLEGNDITSFSKSVRDHYSLCLDAFPEHGRKFFEYAVEMKVDKFKDICGDWRTGDTNPRNTYLRASRLFDGLLYLATDFCFVIGDDEQEFMIDDYETLRKDFMNKHGH